MFFMAKEPPLFLGGVALLLLGGVAIIWAVIGLSREIGNSESRLAKRSSAIAILVSYKKAPRPSPVIKKDWAKMFCGKNAIKKIIIKCFTIKLLTV